MPSFRQTQTVQALHHTPAAMDFLGQLAQESKAVASNAKETVTGLGRELSSEIWRIGSEAGQIGRGILDKGAKMGSEMVSLSEKLSTASVAARLGHTAAEHLSRAPSAAPTNTSLGEKINTLRGRDTAAPGNPNSAPGSIFPHGLRVGVEPGLRPKNIDSQPDLRP